jgi:lysophospholipase L1-like esterase
MTMHPETPLVRRSKSRIPLARAMASTLAIGALAACAKDPDIVEPVTPGNNAAFMARYVALGNSITAGYQSGGINDSTQRQSYARLIARAAGTRYAYASLAGRGCVPPLVNFLTGQRAGTGSTGATCDLRAAATVTSVLNNVAVPGANSYDPTGLAGGGYSPLTQFILGGKTQVQKAIEADPTFVSIWIGNNDVLSFAANGTTTGVTPLATFVQNYAKMMADLRAGSPNLKNGVLIGVVDVTQIPLLVPAGLFVRESPLYSPVVSATVSAALFGGRAIQPVNCPGTTTALLAVPLLQTLATAAAALPAGQPVPLACAPTPVPGLGTLGTSGTLDDAERAFFVSTVASYNAYIKAKADSLGFAYYDPNPRLAALRANGSIPIFPSLTTPTQPFGTFFSVDGVHPAAAAHVLLAQDIVTAVNAKYQSTIPLPTANP